LILASIDIGSNAARLLISKVEKYGEKEVDFTKLNLVRIPLQLGFEVFTTGLISEQKKEMLLQTLNAFKILMTVYQVEGFRVCATSAMRDAKNSKEVIKEIQDKTDILIEVITGQEEATIIYENHLASLPVKGENLAFIDVGGGSTEITVLVNNVVSVKESFNIGTIRLLNNQWNNTEWNRMKQFAKTELYNHQPIKIIGSGGNINKLFSLSKRKEGKPVKLDFFESLFAQMSQLTLEQRMHEFAMREDRANVIVPALHIYIHLLKWSNSNQIFVPKIGLADGIIKHMYFERLKNTK
jgi:exopolyphosphatase/guanosine-5'-triphosphate,3'-diphosphate pyrophosphatase